MKAPPIRFGLTADTGGHIAYVLEAAVAQAACPGVTRVSIVTRLFDDPRLGSEHALTLERLGDRITLDRIATANRAYLEKEALAADLPAFADAFCVHLAGLPRRPDVIHAHFADAAAVALAARARFGIPVVYTPHALGIDKRVQCASEWPDGVTHDAGLDGRIAAEQRAIAAADAIIVSSHDEADRQLGAYGVADTVARTHRIPPGVPRRGQPDDGVGPGDPSNALLAGGLRDVGRPIVLAIARPVRKKNLAALVRAYAATPALVERANLVILSGQHDGVHASAEERAVIAELERLCAAPALRGRVALPPRHDSADVAALYRRAARGGVFVNPALHEPFGLTLIEAAAAAVPVVATRNGGSAEIVRTIGHGLLVDPRDEAQVGAACLAVLSDPAFHRRLSRAALRGAGRFDWAAYAARSVSLYASLRPQAVALHPERRQEAAAA